MRKSAGPDAICGHTLRYCAEQLSGAFFKLFQICAEHCQIPTIWKTSIIVPIAKSRNAKEPSDFRPDTLKSLVMKIIKDKMVSLEMEN